MRRFTLVLFLCFIGANASADMQSLLNSDHISKSTLQQKLADNLYGKDFQITEYSRAWADYNPGNHIPYFGKNYRDISFQFVDNLGQTQKFNCKSFYSNDGSKDLSIYDCSGGTKPLVNFNVDHAYGYSSNNIVLNKVISSSNAGGNGSDGSAAHQ